MVKLNTAGASGGNWVPMEQGLYPLTITNAEEKKSKAKGHAMFALTLEVAVGAHKGTTMRDWIMMEGGAAEWHAAKLNAILGREINDGDEVESMDLQGADVWGYIKHRTYRGNDGEDHIGYELDGKAGPGGCGYVFKDAHPWPTTDEYTVPGVTAGEPPEKKDGEYDFEDIPF